MDKNTSKRKARRQGIILLGMIKKGTHQWPTVTWDPASREVRAGSDEILGQADSEKEAKSFVQSKALEQNRAFKIF